MRRRTFLRGATASLAVLAGCGSRTDETTETTANTGTASPTPTAASPTETSTPASYPYTERFDRVVDIEAEGGDTTGGESINPILEANRGDDTLYYFPPGTYLMDDTWEVREFSNVGVVGNGATITIPPGYRNYLFAFGKPGTARDLLVENLAFDCTAPESGARVVEGRVDDGLIVRDISVKGVQAVDYAATRFDLTSESGSGVIERLRLPDGGMPHSRAVGCYVGDQSVGKLSFVDCRMESFPNNGLYASSSQGPLIVEGGYYANNGISSVRVGNGGVVRNVHVRCDASRSGFENMRGIRLRNGSSAHVENCTVEMLEVTYSDGAIVLEEWLESATIRNTDIRIDTDHIAAIRAKSPGPGVSNDDESRPSLHVEGVDITGSAANNAAISVDSRDRCLFDGISVTQTGANRDGVRLEQSDGNRLRNSAIDVTGEPVVLDNATLKTTNSGIPTPASSTSDTA